MYRPVGARVIVKKLENKVGSVYIPDAFRAKQGLLFPAEVKAVGSGALLENGDRVPVCVREGDVVLIPDSVGYTLWVDGEDYLIVNERDIACVLEASADVQL